MRWLPVVVLLGSLVAGCAQDEEGPRPADLVLLGGHVWTGEPDAPLAEAVAVKGSALLAVGTDAQVRRHVGPGTRAVELDGAFASPG